MCSLLNSRRLTPTNHFAYLCLSHERYVQHLNSIVHITSKPDPCFKLTFPLSLYLSFSVSLFLSLSVDGVRVVVISR